MDLVVETGLESTFDLELHLVSGPILSLLTICVARGPPVCLECAHLVPSPLILGVNCHDKGPWQTVHFTMSLS